MPIPPVNTGWSVLDSLLNTSIAYNSYKTYTEAALRQRNTLGTVEGTGKKPEPYDPRTAKGMDYTPLLIAGGIVLLAVVVLK